MEDKRNLNLIFSKNGSGRVSGKINISKLWMDEMGVTEDDKEVIALFKNDRIIIRRPDKSKHYMLVNDQSGYNDMIRTQLFESGDEANQIAENLWNSFSSEIMALSHVYVIELTESDLASAAFDENGEVRDWAFFKDRSSEEYLFDSYKK